MKVLKKISLRNHNDKVISVWYFSLTDCVYQCKLFVKSYIFRFHPRRSREEFDRTVFFPSLRHPFFQIEYWTFLCYSLQLKCFFFFLFFSVALSVCMYSQHLHTTSVLGCIFIFSTSLGPFFTTQTTLKTSATLFFHNHPHWRHKKRCGIENKTQAGMGKDEWMKNKENYFCNIALDIEMRNSVSCDWSASTCKALFFLMLKSFFSHKL